MIFVGLFLLAQNAFAGGMVITNKATAISALSKSEVKALFLKKKSSFSDGSKVVVGDQTEDSSIRKEFSKQVIGKKTKKLKLYWSKRVFAGKGTPPKEIGDNSAVIAWVAKTPNSLGYVSDDTATGSVKVLLKY